jgi:squalene synthase HpnC
MSEFASGKGHNDENFPVASWLVSAQHRAPIMAFYRVARLADDVSDHASAPAAAKLKRLAEIQASLTGEGDACPEAVTLGRVLTERNLGFQHMLDLLEAFRRDVTKLRYESWDELMDYCRYSAMPVGRFVLDVHGESRATWPASDALCAALQVINHLQDCAKDFRDLNRVYLPRETMVRYGARIEMLASGDPALTATIRALAERSQALLETSRHFAGSVKDGRLALEIGVIHRLAESLVKRLCQRDPMSDELHHSRWETVGVGLLGVGRTVRQRLASRLSRAAGP